MFKFKNIVEIHETHSYSEVNSHLSQGWKLLTFYKQIQTFGSCKEHAVDETLIYVVGRPQGISKYIEPTYKEDEDTKLLYEKLGL